MPRKGSRRLTDDAGLHHPLKIGDGEGTALELFCGEIVPMSAKGSR